MKLFPAALLALALFPAAAQAADGDGPLVSTTMSPASPRPGETVTLTASSAGAGVSYGWDLDGNGTFTDATGATVEQTFARGAHKLGVRATDRSGRTSTEERSFVIDYRKPPQISFPVPAMVGAENELEIPIIGRDSDGSIVKFELDLDGDGTYEISDPGFDDNANGRMFHRVVTFHSAGERVMHARVTDEDGLTASATANVRVVENVPWATVFSDSANGPPRGGQPVRVSAYSNYPGVKYEFDLDGNGSFEHDNGTSNEVSATFPAGPRTVGVRVTDVRGNVTVSHRSDMVFASGQPLNEMFEAGPLEEFGYVGEPIDLGVVVDPFSFGGFTVAWDVDGDGEFDDGLVNTPTRDEGSGNKAHLMHTFTTPGVHEVRVRVSAAGRPTYDFAYTVTIGATGRTFHTPTLDVTVPGETARGYQRLVSTYSDPTSTLEFDLDGDGQFDEHPPSSERGFYLWAFEGPTMISVRATDAASGDTNVRSIQVTPNGQPSPGATLELRADGGGSPLVGGRLLVAETTQSTVTHTGCCALLWDLDDDGVYDDASGPLKPFRTTAGRHSIGVLVIDQNGLNSSIRQTFTVDPGPPEESPVTPIDTVATPTPTPAGPGVEPPPPPALGLRPIVGKLSLRSSALTVKPGCSATCNAEVVVTVSKAAAKKLDLRSTTLGSGSGANTVKVKLTAKARKALSKVRSLKVRIVVTATGADGRRVNATKSMTIR
ncbi:PKD domain-containing protein [Solirubrobacter soli]|uniref:PKD domain-containing protein n=1 Tax=Solirubrobacter soli TaxID=363832 RepID=UPI0004113B75|nr:PKD domain-containing protein [Solirubrobacter soli]